MSNHNSLSLNLLADAFTREEVCNGRVFAVYGSAETLQVVREFTNAIGREFHGTLFYVPLVEADIPPGMLGIGTKFGSKGPTVDDFKNALDARLTDLNAEPTTELWTRIVSLR